jgi:hypothetical protein
MWRNQGMQVSFEGFLTLPRLQRQGSLRSFMPGGFDGPEMAGSQLTVFEYYVHGPPYLYLTVCILSIDHIDHFKIKRSSHLLVFL